PLVVQQGSLIRSNVGDGEATRFWMDPWIEEAKFCKVSDRFLKIGEASMFSWRWNKALLSAADPLELTELMSQLAVMMTITCLVDEGEHRMVIYQLIPEAQNLSMDITILGCNDFYSYRNQIEARGLPLVPESLVALPPFQSITFNVRQSNVENRKPEVAKTGLGSSAAMTTVVVSALLNYVGVVDLPYSSKDQKLENSSDLDLVHMIAQTAHYVAQGKVSSGFGVSSAVYGSHCYVRFHQNHFFGSVGCGKVTCFIPSRLVMAAIDDTKYSNSPTHKAVVTKGCSGLNALDGAGAPASDEEVQQEVQAMSQTNIFTPGIDVTQAVLLPQMTWRRQQALEVNNRVPYCANT
ncbi:hypothetical protein M8C21_027291, partial [Ambrosia artemisiifolia]